MGYEWNVTFGSYGVWMFMVVARQLEITDKNGGF